MSTALFEQPAPATVRERPSESAPSTPFPYLRPAAGALGRLDDYLVLRVLGTGGMGIVFLARDLALDREVALKVIDAHASRDETARRYFLREARAMAALDHENVVPIYRVGEANGVLFLAMPVLRGRTLEAWLNESPRRPIADVLRIAREVAEGLAAAHAKGLVHRDVKPANVWLEEARRAERGTQSEDNHEPDPGSARSEIRAPSSAFGRVKLLDFGLARPLAADQQITAKEFVVGTPGYLAPELIQGAVPTPACDLYGLGALLYQCFAGEVPFPCESPVSTLLATITAEPVELSERVPDLPAPVAELVMRLLAKKPEDRPRSARAVADRLRELERDPHCAASEVLAPVLPKGAPVAAPGRAWLWRATAALIASAGVALAVAPYTGSRTRALAEAPAAEPPAPSPAPPVAPVTAPQPAFDLLKPLATYTGLTAPAMAASYSADGRTFFVMGEDGYVHEWHNGMPGPSRKKWQAHPGRGYGVVVCPNGRIITGGNDDAGVSMVVGWNPQTLQSDWSIKAGVTWTNIISVNRDGTRAVATGRGGTAVVFDPRTGDELPPFKTEEWLSGVAISPDGTRVVTASQWEPFARVWDVANELCLDKPGGLPACGGKTAFSPDGRVIAVCGMDGPVRLWNADTGEIRSILYGHETPATSIAFSPDGSRLVTGGTDKTVRVWDLKSSDELAVFRGHADVIWAVCYAPHGKQILSAGRDRRVFTWANPR